MTIRVLICRSNPIDPDPRVEKIALALVESGYQVSIIGWDRTGNLKSESSLLSKDSNIHLYRLPIRSEYGHGLANLPNLIRWQFGLMKWLVQHRQEYDLIHACDFDTILPALISKWLWGKKVIYDIFDFYADHLRATPNLLRFVIRKIDLRAIGWSDAIILADESRWSQIEGAKPKQSAVIYNSPADQALVPTPEQEIQPSSSIRLAYIGLLQVERGLIEMLEVLQKHPEWYLDLAGYGGDEDFLHSKAKQLPNVKWFGRISYERALELSKAADLLFALYDPKIQNHRYASPNKVFEAMMLGKPIIVARDTNMDRIIQQADCGVVIKYGEQSALEEVLTHLQNDINLRKKMGENARKAYESIYSWSLMTGRLRDLYSQVAGPNKEK